MTPILLTGFNHQILLGSPGPWSYVSGIESKGVEGSSTYLSATSHPRRGLTVRIRVEEGDGGRVGS